MRPFSDELELLGDGRRIAFGAGGSELDGRTGGMNPGTALNVSRLSPGLSGSSSVSTTMISPALNCL